MRVAHGSQGVRWLFTLVLATLGLVGNTLGLVGDTLGLLAMNTLGFVANVLVTLGLGENVLSISEVTSDMSVQVVLTMEVSGAEGIGELVSAVRLAVAGVEDLTIMMGGVTGRSIEVETVLGTGCGRMTMTVVEAKRVFLNSIFSSVIFL